MQFLLLEMEDGSYAIILPLIDQTAFRGTLRPPRCVPPPQNTPTHTLVLPDLGVVSAW